MGRAPRTKETLPDFLKWRRVTRPPLVFRELTGSQRTPGFWGVTDFPIVKHIKVSSDSKVRVWTSDQFFFIKFGFFFFFILGCVLYVGSSRKEGFLIWLFSLL